MKQSTAVKHVVLRAPRLHSHDAVSTDLILQADALKKDGWDVTIVAKSQPSDFSWPVLLDDRAFTLLRDKNVLCINHFTGFDYRLFALRGAAKGPFVFRYHNVTPAKWFVSYSFKGFLFALFGRVQAYLFMLMGHCDLLLSPSQFNIDDLTRFIPKSFRPKAAVLPVFRQFDLFRRDALSSPKEGVLRVLMVGRIVPNKGYEHVVDILTAWKSDPTLPSLQVKIVGKKFPEFEDYHAGILRRAKHYDVLSSLEFCDEVSENELKNLYNSSDVFLSLSEHEGFGVPLVEAQASDLPVLALARAAVPEIVGDGGVLLCMDSPFNSTLFVEALRKIYRDLVYRKELTARGRINAERFKISTSSAKLKTEISDIY